MMLNNSPRIIRPNAGFILPGSRFLDLEVSTAKVYAKGEFKLVKHERGIVIQETPWFDNILLNAGLNRWGTAGCITGAGIGTGTSTPVATQTGLDTEAHWTTTTGTGHGTQTAPNASPYNNSYTVVYRTALGALNGNYSEVAVGWASGNNKLSRALILDGSSNPTTIAVSSSQQLDIWYKFSVYPPLADIGPTTLSIGGTNYNITGRASAVNSNTGSIGWNPSRIVNNFGSASDGAGFNSIFDNVMGAITANPTGSGSTGGAGSTNAYVNSSLNLTGSMTYGLTAGNFAGGVKSTKVCWGPAAFQYEFNNTIPKDGTKVLVFNFSVSWARRP